MADRRLTSKIRGYLAIAAACDAPLAFNQVQALAQAGLIDRQSLALTERGVKAAEQNRIQLSEGCVARIRLNHLLDLVVEPLPEIFEAAYRAGFERAQHRLEFDKAACDRAYREQGIQDLLDTIKSGRNP